MAKTNPAEAIRLFLRLVEFVTPKRPAATVDMKEAVEVQDTTRRRRIHELSMTELESIAAGARLARPMTGDVCPCLTGEGPGGRANTPGLNGRPPSLCAAAQFRR